MTVHNGDFSLLHVIARIQRIYCKQTLLGIVGQNCKAMCSLLTGLIDTSDYFYYYY